MDQQVSRESKLTAAKDIVANYVRNNANLSPDEVCDLLKKVYSTVDEITPDPGDRRIGLA